MSVCALICRTCGGAYDLSAGESHKPCPACGAENCRPQAEADVGDLLRRATGQRLRCDFKNAEATYQFVLNTSPDEHEALWGLVQCRYAVEYVKDPHTGKPQPIVHAVRTRPMLTDPDFREACSLAPEAVREQYRQEAEYIDGAMARIRELAASGDEYDVFLCHKTTRTDGVEGYTEDYNRAVQLYIMLRDMGCRTFFAPFAGLTPGDNYEAGIYHAISTAKVMLVVCSNQDHINSPWVRTEWQRFLEMSYEPGADKHLIPLLYEGFPPRRLPDDFRQLQAISMGELNAKDLLVAAVNKHVGRSAPVTAAQPVRPAPAPEAVGEGLVPSRPAPQPTPSYAPESDFKTKTVRGIVRITRYVGSGGEVLIPPTIGGLCVAEIGKDAFKNKRELTKVVIPAGVTTIRDTAFSGCSDLTSVSIPESVTSLGTNPFLRCNSLADIAVAAGNSKYYVRDGVLLSRANELLCYPAGSSVSSYTIPTCVTRVGEWAFFDCIGLTNVSIPAGVTSIGNWAFDGCSSLISVSIPESVTDIGASAFSSCSSLADIMIPANVTSIGNYAFANCPTLTLRVYPNTSAHTYAQQNNLRFALIGTAPQPVSTAPTPAYAPERNFKTKTVRGIVRITSYVGSGGEVLIPPTIGGLCVAEIGKGAFENKRGLTKVVIPAGVTTISDTAFRDCSSLTSVTIPESVTIIGEFAFKDCSSLTSVSIPASVSKLGSNPFAKCKALKTISVAAGNKKYYVRDNVLMSREHELVCYPAGLAASSYGIPAGVTSIGSFAFAGCTSLTSVSVPEGVMHIGNWAFRGCSSLTSVGIPEGVTSIGACAFDGCSSLTSVSIPEGVTSIRNNAFRGCSSLTSVSIPEGMTWIEYGAFDGCSSLASVSIPAGVTSIGSFAFAACPNLTLRVHPNTPAHAYAQEKNLRFALIGSAAQPVQPTPAYAPESDFKTKEVAGGVAITGYIGPGGEVLIPATIGGKRVVEIGEAFVYREKKMVVVIPEGVTNIADRAFYRCSGLMSVSIPESVTGIGVEAFYWCSSLMSVSIPERVTSIGESAFSLCSSLTNVNIPEGVTSIGECAFWGCSSLTGVSIPASVISLSGNPFSHCKGLKVVSVAEENSKYYVRDGVLLSRDREVVCCPAGLPATVYAIPAGTTSIGDRAFQGCSSLTSVSIPDNVMSIGECAFEGCSSLTSMSIPEGVTSIQARAFECCSGLTSVSIPDSVTSIGDMAFGSCSGLTSVSIPDSVMEIGDGAFGSCSGLTIVSIPKGVTQIGENAFAYCPNLTVRVYQGSVAHKYAQQNGIRFEVPSLFSRLFGKK